MTDEQKRAHLVALFNAMLDTVPVSVLSDGLDTYHLEDTYIISNIGSDGMVTIFGVESYDIHEEIEPQHVTILPFLRD